MTLKRKAGVLEHSAGMAEVGKRSLPRHLMGRSKGKKEEGRTKVGEITDW